MCLFHSLLGDRRLSCKHYIGIKLEPKGCTIHAIER
jgi:hypothetical protein